MTEILTRNETTYNGVLSNEEIDMLLTAVDKKKLIEKKIPTDPFNEIVKLDDRAIQKVMREINCLELSRALKSADYAVMNKMFNNMSKRASRMLKEDMEYMGPVRLRDFTDARKHIFSIIYHLIDTGEINIPEGFPSYNDLVHTYGEFALNYNELRSNGIFTGYDSAYKDINEFTAFLTGRYQPETPYGYSYNEITMCHFFESKENEKILADIEQKNKEQGMGNYQIPNTNIKFINYSICPKCDHVFSFKDLIDYYANPKPDKTFNNRSKQFREDTRVFCHECGTYFLPALVISDGTPKNEVQFLCRVQTANAIEKFYRNTGKTVLSKNKKNLVEKTIEGKTVKAIRNDVSLKELSAKPTLVSNLLQYTPANLALNLIDGTNIKKGDVLYGKWQ
jgi:ssDNA-binding Zn-finger/Zn-ribbon topoisomerase 1